MQYQRFILLFISLFILSSGCSGNPAQSGSSVAPEEIRTLARNYVQAFINTETAKVEAEHADRVVAKLQALIDNPKKPDNPLEGFLKDGEPGEKELGEKLAKIIPTVRANLKEKVVSLAASTAKNKDDAENWAKDLETVLVQEHRLKELDSSRDFASTLGFYLSGANRLFWLFSFIALFMVLLASLHARRHEVRRLFNGGKAKAVRAPIVLTVLVAGLAIITLGVFLFGDRIYQTLSSSGTAQRYTEVKTDLADLAKKPKPTAVNLESLKDKVEAVNDLEMKKWVQENVEFYTALLKLYTINQTTKVVAEKWKDDAAQAEVLNEKLAQRATELEQLEKDRFRMQAWLGTFMLLAACGIIFWLYWRERKIEQFNRLKCPKCLAQGTLKSKPNGEGLLECKAPQCNFDMPREYQGMSKLYFPLLGHIQAGKTFWLAMNYKQLNEGNFPPGVQFEKLDGRSSQEFDKIVSEVFTLRKTKAQQYSQATSAGGIPFPLIYNFLDNDMLGKSKMLVSLFDYSGEVTINPLYTFDQSNIRRRAMFADGYLFFLDPTENISVQQAALDRFRQDVRRARKKSIGSTLDMPIALVISKIDTLFEPKNVAKYGKENLKEMLKELDSIQKVGTKLREQDMNLRIIEQRSAIMEKWTGLLFPGWQIARQVTDLFGGRVMFFPETPIGLNDLGKPVDQRLMEPFGLLEPLLWLIHMNGYPVLGR